MLSPRAKMRINLTVKDYIEMFPDDYKDVLTTIEYQRANLADEMAEIKSTHAIKRALLTLPEKLFQMIQKKLDEREMSEFRDIETQRWFGKEYPQFRISKQI